MILVGVEWPIIQNDTVKFFWYTNKKVPFFIKNNFYIKYEGINLEKIPYQVHWNTFLALMIPIFNLCEEDILFIFPENIPAFLVETWINYHAAKNVLAFPLSDQKKVLIAKDYKKPRNTIPRVGIFYGGGKDSNYAFSILSEIYGMEGILLISYVTPPQEKEIDNVDKRREKFLLKPLRQDLGVKIQKVITDYRAIMTSPSISHHASFALYTGTIVPVIIYYNISLLTHSNEFDHFWTHYYDTGKIHFHHRRIRPEYDQYISARTNSFFKTDILIKNINFFISEAAALKILVNRYPHMLQYLLICEHTNNPQNRWCYKCEKCATFAFYTLYYGIEQHDMDLDFFFSKSPYIKKVLKDMEGIISPVRGGMNWPYISSLGCAIYYQLICHAIASIVPENVEKKVSGRSYENFMLLKERYGNEKYTIVESFIEPAFKKLNLSSFLSQKVRTIVTSCCATVKEMPEFICIGDKKVVFDYNLKCNIPNIFSMNLEKGDIKNVESKIVSGLKEIGHGKKVIKIE